MTVIEVPFVREQGVLRNPQVIDKIRKLGVDAGTRSLGGF